MAAPLMRLPDGRWVQPALISSVCTLRLGDNDKGLDRGHGVVVQVAGNGIAIISEHATEEDAELARDRFAAVVNDKLKWQGGL